MWNKNSSNPKSLSNAFQSGAGETTYIAADSEFIGNITLKGNARIDGLIEGAITLTGDLMIGPSAVIKASIQADTISISGEVRGDITARESLELCPSARLYGNISTQQLKIDQGAQFIGTSRLLGDAVEVSGVNRVAVLTGETNEEPLEEVVNGTPEITLEHTESLGKAVGFAKPKSKRR